MKKMFLTLFLITSINCFACQKCAKSIHESIHSLNLEFRKTQMLNEGKNIEEMRLLGQYYLGMIDALEIVYTVVLNEHINDPQDNL